MDEAATERVAELLARRLDLVSAGLFPHATEKDACRWCDYEGVCGGAERRAEQAARVIEALADPEAGDGAEAARRLRRWADG